MVYLTVLIFCIFQHGAMEVNKNFLEEDNVDSNFENVLISVNLNYYVLVTAVFPKHVSNSIPKTVLIK